MSHKRLVNGAFLSFTLLANMGCQDSPSRVPSPEWAPHKLAVAVREQLDTNTDGVLDPDELKAAPGLAAGAVLIDTDGDQRLTEEEIAKRFETYRRLAIGRTSRAFRFVFNGKPLTNASIEFVPERFLEGIIKPAKAISDSLGIAHPHTEGENIPGMQVGYYRIQVSSAEKKLPPKYGESSPLGIEVSGTNDDPSGYETKTFVIDSK